MATMFELAARLQAAGAVESLLLIIAKATLILLIARLLLAVMPRASAATKHVVATAALVAVAAMPLLTVIVPAWEIAVKQRVVQAPQPASVTPSPAATESKPEARTTPAKRPTALGTTLSIARATRVVPDEPLTAMERALSVGKATWKGLIVIALAAVALLYLGQMLVGMFGVWHVARNATELELDDALVELDRARDQLALERDVRLLVSSRISMPVIWGVFRPVLLLPADVAEWPIERLRVVLLHELAHLKRFDGISLIATRIAVALFWYHPLAWSLERRGRSECERACDDLVLAGGTRPSEYADHLLAIAKSMPSFDPFRSVTLAMSRRSQLEGRLLSILQTGVARRVFSGRGVAIACAVAVALIAPIAALRLIAEPSNKKDVEYALKKSESKSDSEITVTSDIEAIGDYMFTKLGKLDKRIDRLAREPKNGKDWYERAYDYYRSDRYQEAADAFRRAAEMGFREQTSLYNEACSWALLEDADHAVRALQQAVAEGWDAWDHLADDSDFDPIRSNAAFVRFVNTASGDAATRRVEKTMERYSDMLAGKETKEAIEDAVEEGIEGTLDAAVEGILGAFDQHDKRNDWYEVGLDLLRLRRLDDSIEAFKRSIAEQEKSASAMYNIACAYSLKHDARSGMAWLEKAVEEGFGGDDKLRNDPDIAFLRTQREFESLRRKAKELEMHGCCDDDEDDAEGWREAVEFHQGVVRKYPQSGRAWFNLGFAAIRAGDYATGTDAYNRGLQLGHRKGTALYNLACINALQGNRDAAFDYLNKARAEGFELRGYMNSDEDLENLHGDPRWEALREEVGANRGWLSKSNHK